MPEPRPVECRTPSRSEADRSTTQWPRKHKRTYRSSSQTAAPWPCRTASAAPARRRRYPTPARSPPATPSSSHSSPPTRPESTPAPAPPGPPPSPTESVLYEAPFAYCFLAATPMKSAYAPTPGPKHPLRTLSQLSQPAKETLLLSYRLPRILPQQTAHRVRQHLKHDPVR